MNPLDMTLGQWGLAVLSLIAGFSILNVVTSMVLFSDVTSADGRIDPQASRGQRKFSTRLGTFGLTENDDNALLPFTQLVIGVLGTLISLGTLIFKQFWLGLLFLLLGGLIWLGYFYFMKSKH